MNKFIKEELEDWKKILNEFIGSDIFYIWGILMIISISIIILASLGIGECDLFGICR